MKREEIFKIIDELVYQVSKGEVKGYKSEEHFEEELPLDSLDRLTFLLEIGDKYGIEIKVEEAVEKKLRFVNNLVNYIEENT